MIISPDRSTAYLNKSATETAFATENGRGGYFVPQLISTSQPLKRKARPILVLAYLNKSATETAMVENRIKGFW